MFPVVEEKIKWDDYGELIRFVDIHFTSLSMQTNRHGRIGSQNPQNVKHYLMFIAICVHQVSNSLLYC